MCAGRWPKVLVESGGPTGTPGAMFGAPKKCWGLRWFPQGPARVQPAAPSSRTQRETLSPHCSGSQRRRPVLEYRGHGNLHLRLEFDGVCRARHSDRLHVDARYSPRSLRGTLVRPAPRSCEPGGAARGASPAIRATADTLSTIARAVEAERTACRFLRFAITVEPEGGPVFLEFSCPRGTREFVAALLERVSTNLAIFVAAAFFEIAGCFAF